MTKERQHRSYRRTVPGLLGVIAGLALAATAMTTGTPANAGGQEPATSADVTNASTTADTNRGVDDAAWIVAATLATLGIGTLLTAFQLGAGISLPDDYFPIE